MTDQEINVAIADACGYVKEEPFFDFNPRVVKNRKSEPLPDYCGDLNAMHDAEKTLTQEQCALYVEETCSIQAYDAADDEIEELIVFPCEHKWFHSTARQRAEAFLRTVGRWTE